MIFSAYLGKYEKLLQAKYSISGTIRHKGERGRQRENGLAMFLREMLPAAYGVATGEIIPWMGKDPSPQCDIIIYDRLRMPIFGANEAVQQVPLEGVYAVIETKSAIDSKALGDAARKFKKIRSLPRATTTRPRKGKFRGPLLMLFGYRFATTREACEKFIYQFGDVTASVCALDAGLTLWIEEDGRNRWEGLPLKAQRGIWLCTGDPSQNFHETLTWFLVVLLQNLLSIDLGTPSFTDYITDK